MDRKAYHTVSLGFYQNEIARRVDTKGRSLDKIFKEEITDPLGINNTFLGVPDYRAQHKIAKIAFVDPLQPILNSEYENPDKLLFNFVKNFPTPLLSFLNPPFLFNMEQLNTKKIRALKIASGFFFSNAHDLAKIYGEFAMGCPTLKLKKETIKELEAFPHSPNNYVDDLVLAVNMIYSLGFEKPSPYFNFGTNSKSYGHQGAGGSTAFADPEAKLGYAYVMNKMGSNIANDPREKALRDAIYKCL